MTQAIKAAGVDLIGWLLERSGPITPENDSDWYYGSVNAIAGNKGAIYEVIDTLTQDVGVKDIFSNRPATVT